MSGGQWMVVLIVLIAVMGGVLKDRARKGRKRWGEAEQVEAAALRREVMALRERVQVLERVVTDNHGSLGLDREIERLRDR